MTDGLVVTKVPGRLAHYLCMQNGTTVVPLARFQSEDAVKVFMDYLKAGAGKPLKVNDEPVLTNAAIPQPSIVELASGGPFGLGPNTPKNYSNRGG